MTDPEKKENGIRPEPPKGRLLRKLKSRAQLLKPVVRVGKRGVTDEVVRALDQALEAHELVKVKFSDFEDREEKRRWITSLAERTGSVLIQQVGHVAVYYRSREGGSEETTLS